MSSSLLARIAKNSTVGLLEKLIEILAGVASVAILARYLDIETFGLYTVITTVAALIFIICGAGLDRVMVRDIAADKGNLLKYLQDVKGATIILAGISLFLVIIISYLLDLNNKMTLGAIFIFAVSELISMYVSVYMSVFRAFEKMEYNTFITFIARIITLLGLIAVAYFRLGFLSIFVSMVMGNIFKAVLTFSMFRMFFSSAQIPVSFMNSQAITKGSLTIAFSAFFAVTSIRMGVYLLKAFGSLEDVAFFQVSNSLFILLQPISIVIVAALYPVMSRREKDAEHIFEKAAKFLFIISLPVTAITFFYGHELIFLVYGSKYINAVSAMKILVLSVSFTFLANLFEASLLSDHKQHLLTAGWGIAFSVNIVMGLLIIPRYGLIGYTAVAFMAYMSLFFSLYFFMSHYTRFKLKSNIFVRPCVAFIAMGSYLYFFASTARPLNIKLALLNITVSLALYMTVLFIMKVFSIKEIGLIKSLLIQKKISELP